MASCAAMYLASHLPHLVIIESIIRYSHLKPEIKLKKRRLMIKAFSFIYNR